tara:strand:- start:5330 stop:5875 length:546 start_codon:yes stop_codon:yes gene_type:complete
MAKMTDTDLRLNDTPAPSLVERHPDLFAGIDPHALRAAQDLLRVSKRLLGGFADRFREHGLSPGRYSVLMTLHAAGGPLAPSVIAERIGVTRASTTGLVTGLARDGLVEYGSAGETDRRRKTVGLTEAGTALLLSILPDIFARMTALVEPLTEAECKTLQSILARIEADLGQDATSETRHD